MSSQHIINDVLPKLITTLNKIDTTTKGTDDTISTLRDSVDELERAARDLESTNNMLHESLTRLERNIIRIDTRLRRIEDELQKKKQTQQEADRIVKRVQESEDKDGREKRQKVASRGPMTNISEERRQQSIMEQAKTTFAEKTWSDHFGTNWEVLVLEKKKGHLIISYKRYLNTKSPNA